MAGRKDENGLTPRRLKFCQEYVKCGNASEAYRRSFSTKNMASTTVTNNAHILMRDTDVSAMVRKLTVKTAAKAEKDLDITVETTIRDLTDAMAFSKECGNPSALVNAIMGRGKVLGHVIDRKDISISKTIEGMTDDELDALIDDAIDSEEDTEEGED